MYFLLNQQYISKQQYNKNIIMIGSDHFCYKYKNIANSQLIKNMKSLRFSSQNNLTSFSHANTSQLYSESNLNQTQTFQRLFKVVLRIAEQPTFSQQLNQNETIQNKHLDENIPLHQQFVQSESMENDIIRNNFDIEQPKLKNKTSIQNRIPSSFLNYQTPSPLTMSVLPIENYRTDNYTLRLIDTDDGLNIQHIQALFKIQQTSVMVLTLAYLSKLSSSQTQFHYQMNSTLRKFAASYLMARKMSEQYLEVGVIGDISSVLGLDPDTLLRLQRQFLVSVNFDLQLPRECLNRVCKALFD